MSEHEFRMIAVGDIMLGDSSHFLGRGMGTRIAQLGPEYPFAEVKNQIKDADVFVGNLESPLSRNPGLGSWDKVYRGPEVGAQCLNLARRNILTLANNHILEHGPTLLEETRNILDQAGINHAGLSPGGGRHQATFNWDEGGVPVSLFCDSLIRDRSHRVIDVPATEEWLVESLRSADASVRIVALHWGDEYVQCPSPKQKRLARLLIENGASLVLGHHPHVLQPVERIGSGLVAYSLGNFVFDQNWTNETRGGGMLDVQMGSSGVKSWRFIPTICGSNNRPRYTTDVEGAALLNVINGSHDSDTDTYERQLAKASRHHRIMMKWELLRNFHRVKWDTWHFLATKRRRP